MRSFHSEVVVVVVFLAFVCDALVTVALVAGFVRDIRSIDPANSCHSLFFSFLSLCQPFSINRFLSRHTAEIPQNIHPLNECAFN